MGLKRLEKKLSKKVRALCGSSVNVAVENASIVLRGTLRHWEDIVTVCSAAVNKKSGMHVVNDIRLEGAETPLMRTPSIEDNALDGCSPDVLIIGGGISGVSIMRELSKWQLDILLVEKESDLALQASGRNDGEVHTGTDLFPGTLKHSYIRRANAMYDSLCADLSVPFARRGQYVGFTQGWTFPFVYIYYLVIKYISKIEDTVLLSGKTVRSREKYLNPDLKFALYNASAGVVCPYNLTIAFAENAVQNGARVMLNTAVTWMDIADGEICSVYTNRGVIHPKIVINAAGVFAEDIAKMASDRFYSIHPRRGTNTILDKKAAYILNSIATMRIIRLGKAFDENRKHTKGGGVIHTAHDNLLVGPNAVETYEKENFATYRGDVDAVFEKQRQTSPHLSQRDIITYFTGVRAATFEEDFIIEKGRKTSNLIHCAGIQSPGLTTAPAVALDIEFLAVDMLSRKFEVQKNMAFNPKRKKYPVLRDLSNEERDALIRSNPDYGEIVCRCEEISKGEIIDALNSCLCVPTVDGIKKRLRPGMGRCQGGFCSPLVTKIIAEHLGVPLSEVKKSGNSSVITFGERELD